MRRTRVKDETIVDRVRAWSESDPDALAFRFLVDGDARGAVRTLSAGQLDRMARAVGTQVRQAGVDGGRALLLCPPGLDYITGFYGCLYAGAVAVPAFPPEPARLERTLPRIQAIADDCEPRAVLCTRAVASMAREALSGSASLRDASWIAIDDIDEAAADEFEFARSDGGRAYLQYTSGSTARPKGVDISHENVVHNLEMHRVISRPGPEAHVVSWLPPFHDMGLILGVLFGPFARIGTTILSPRAFVERPIRWLSAISHFRGTQSSAPNFAFDLCAHKIDDRDVAQLDLSSWDMVYNGAEPVRNATIERFCDRFGASGFARSTMNPGYGLAEATLIVSAGPPDDRPHVEWFDADALARGQLVERSVDAPGATPIVACGRLWQGTEVAIVDTDSRTRCADDRVGEIWIRGESVARGYYNGGRDSEQAFGARIEGEPDATYLRSGDLGVMRDDRLFITGRIKDVIIVRGRNLYPQDIEAIVETSHPSLRLGCGAAVSIDRDGEERLAVVHEVGPVPADDVDAVFGAIREVVSHAFDVQVDAVVLIRPRTIPKTSSGKIQRAACKLAFDQGSLDVVGRAAEPVESLVQAVDPVRATKDRAAIERWIVEWIATTMQMAVDQIDPTRPFAQFGVDSVTAVDLARDLEDWLGIALPSNLVWSAPRISTLADKLAARLG